MMLEPQRWLAQLDQGAARATITATDDLVLSIQRLVGLGIEHGRHVRVFAEVNEDGSVVLVARPRPDAPDFEEQRVDDIKQLLLDSFSGAFSARLPQDLYDFATTGRVSPR